MEDWKHLTEALGDLDEDLVSEILEEFITTGPSEKEVQMWVKACQAGMGIVGDRFETGEYFVGDLIFAGELLTNAIQLLRPIMGRSSGKKVGIIVLGTVHGDLHDIGKNIFKSMAEAAGFEVHDLGIDQPVSAFVDRIKEVKPDIVGLSGLLTLALEAMKDTVDGIKKAGLNYDVKIIIGGNPVTAEVCEHVGADAFTTNAAEGVKICQGWVSC